VTSWATWYIQAILHMARTEAKDTLARLLMEQEYEQDAAWGLFQLARTDAPSSMVWPRNWSMRAKNFDFVWRARAGETEVGFVEPLRVEVSALLRTRVDEILAERAAAEYPEDFDHRLKQLAVALAEVDGRASSETVLDILNFPEPSAWPYGAWSRIHGLEALLMQGVVLPSGKTWEIVEPIIKHVRAHRWNPQELSLMSHVVCIVLFTDDPSASIQRVRLLIEEKLLSTEGLPGLTKALGYSRCPVAVALLRELANDNGRIQHLGDDWVDAVARVDSKEARDLLMSFVDPTLAPLSRELIRHHDGRLVRRLAELAQRDATVQRRMFDLAKENIPASQATVLGKVLASLGTLDALLASLELLRDDDTGGGSYELHRAIERAFVEHRPYGGSSNVLTMVPRSSNAIRGRLMEMVQSDPLRRKSAFALLNEIEKWRMWHGRPDGEPRSPKMEASFLWPPELEGNE
jgi:hypothetical protein